MNFEHLRLSSTNALQWTDHSIEGVKLRHGMGGKFIW